MAARPDANARQRADESVALRFSRLMKATTSPWGILTDPPIVAAAIAIPLMATLAYRGLGLGPAAVSVLQIVTALPIAVAVVTFVALSSARGKVVSWIAGLPFPLGNVNAVLNGVGEEIEVEFDGALPETAELNRRLDAVHPDCFVTSTDEAHHIVVVRIGVVDSKRNPARTNHQRYRRLQEIVDKVLVPLAGEHVIRSARIQ